MERQFKDSGIAWADQIPVDWRVIKGKNLLNLMSRPVRQTDDVVTCFRDGEVVLRSERRTEGFTMSDKEIGYQGINKGDIVIHGMDGFAGAMGVSKSTGKGSPVLIVCTPKDNDDSRYIIYYLRAMAMNNVFLALATGIRERSCDLRWNKISDLPFIRPNADEQKRIANYIDKKCGEIDELIEVQEQMIQKLTDYKNSVITEAVTKGLNPNVRLVPSGIDWIGDIPEGWNVCRIKDLVNLQSGTNLTSLDISDTGSYPVYGGNGMRGYYSHYSNDGDFILIGRQGALCGNINYARGKFWATEHAVICYPKRKFAYMWLGELLRAMNLGQYSLSAAQPGLAVERIKNLKMPLPSFDEQRYIAEYLNEKCSDIDSLIALKQQKIEKLKDYKKSVIYEAVTGKIVIA